MSTTGSDKDAEQTGATAEPDDETSTQETLDPDDPDDPDAPTQDPTGPAAPDKKEWM